MCMAFFQTHNAGSVLAVSASLEISWEMVWDTGVGSPRFPVLRAMLHRADEQDRSGLSQLVLDLHDSSVLRNEGRCFMI